ncbi:kinase-like protein [Xylaria acuta]|nr:kinase-like protein [Xylaria acuta]
MPSKAVKMMQLASLAQDIKERFQSSKYWEYEKFLGNGAYGLTLLLREMDRFVVRQKRIAIKLARSGAAERAQLKNELKILKRLRGAKHIVKMVASCDDLRSVSTYASRIKEQTNPLGSIVGVFGKLTRLPPSAAFVPLEGIMEGPAVALEYLDKGDLVSVKIRTDYDGEVMPNKVLWSLFLCLIRACIGMAYPLERPEGSRSILETIPADGPRASGVIHNDVAPRNIMIASGDGLEEHHIEHMFKLIDFGSARVYDPPRGPRENIYDCAKTMFGMLDFIPIGSYPVVWKDGVTRAGNILPPEDEPDNDPYPLIDLDLRDLIARCMYSDAAKRPSLQEALETGQRALAKDLDDFPEPDEETDESIRDFFQRYIFDVPESANFRG